METTIIRYFILGFSMIILTINNAISQANIPSKDESRIKHDFNIEWKFRLGDFDGAEKINYNEIAWQHIGLPHSFSITYFISPDFYVGYG